SVVQNDPVERVDPRTLLKSGKVFTIRLVATRTALEPPLMVMLPGQRVKVVFENQTGKATNLMFDFPQAAKFTFPENVPNGGEQSFEAVTPELEQTYHFYTLYHRSLDPAYRRKEMIGKCIITNGVTRQTVKPGKARDLVIVAREHHFSPSSIRVWQTEHL